MQIVSNLPYLRNKIFYVCIFHFSSLTTLPFPYISPPLHFYTAIKKKKEFSDETGKNSNDGHDSRSHPKVLSDAS